jgi:3-isopropylmalate dehydrogenase
MNLNINVLPGDGIGPEVIAEAVRVLEAVAEYHEHTFDFYEHAVGAAALREYGVPLPESTLTACLLGDAVLLGAVGDPSVDHVPAAQRPEAGLLELRKALAAFANLRPAVARRPLLDCSPLRREIVEGANVLIVRELLGGLYFGVPRQLDVNEAYNTMRYSRAEVERVARVAFEAAQRRSGRVTSVDKANVLETSRFWRSIVTEVAADYSDVVVEHLYVDACAMYLVSEPRRFDVLLAENVFGDVLSDEAAVIAGSLGLLGSASVGGPVGLFEPVHGSAPGLAGLGVANPLGAIAAAGMLLEHAGLRQEAADVDEAIEAVLAAGYRTVDLSGGTQSVTTSEMGGLVVQALAEIIDRRHAWFAV